MTKKEKREGEKENRGETEDQTQCFLSPGVSKLSSTDKVSSSSQLSSPIYSFFTFTRRRSLSVNWIIRSLGESSVVHIPPLLPHLSRFQG